MADKTISFKIEEELSERVKNLIEGSGLTAKDWFNKAVALSEIQSVKEGTPDYASDLNELEIHTARVYELVSNMIQKSIYLRESAVQTLQSQLEQQRQITSEFQFRVNEITGERDQALNDLAKAEHNQYEFEKQLTEIRETLETNKLLINEYKDKNDTLNGLVTKYKAYADENEQLKETLATERTSHQSAIAKLTQQNNENQSIITNLQQQINSLTEAHKVAYERLTEQRNLQQATVLLEAERSHQQALTKANEEYTNTLKGLYEQLESERKNYSEREQQLQEKIRELQQPKRK